MAADPTQNPPGPMATARDWLGLAVLALPCILYAMDLTVLNLAIPAISADLRPTAAQLLWIVDIYGFILAGSLLVMGALGDRFGRRKLLLVGASAFGVISLLAAFSPSAEMLIAARAVLGLAGATLAPSTLSLIRTMFRNERQRAFAVSVWVASFSAGGALGPVIGGLLLVHFWWGSVFLLALPVGALVLVIGPLVLPEYRNPDGEPLDIPSAILSLTTVLPAIYGIKALAEGDNAFIAAAAIVVGLVFGVIFLRRQSRLAEPLLDLGLFRRPALVAALGINVLDFLVGFGILVLVAQYLQLVLGLDPLQAGLWGLPAAIGFVAGSFLTSPLLAVLPRPRALALGLVAGALGLLVMAHAAGAHDLPVLVGGNVLMAVGTASVTAIVADLVVGLAPEERAGAASALNETSSEFGGALGIALLGSLATYTYRTALASSAPDGIPPEVMAMALRGLGAARSIALNGPVAPLLRQSSDAAFTSALEAALVIGAALLGLAAFVAGWRRRAEPSPAGGNN